jgi:hypothetical protein
MNTIKVYVGCAIKHAPPEFVEQIKAFRDELEKYPRFKVLKFLGRGTPHDIFTWDIRECVDSADVMIAFADLPSTGLGYEMATHFEKNKRPLLVVAHEDATVSGLVLGIHGDAHFEFARYKHLSQVGEMFIAFLERALPTIQSGWKS